MASREAVPSRAGQCGHGCRGKRRELSRVTKKAEARKSCREQSIDAPSTVVEEAVDAIEGLERVVWSKKGGDSGDPAHDPERSAELAEAGAQRNEGDE